jgi:hypothetical protein
MTTQPNSIPSLGQSNQDHHGPFYRSAELVAGVHRAERGVFPGLRAAYAYGRIYAGTFIATPGAKFSLAAHFQGTPVPVTTQLSGTPGPVRGLLTPWTGPERTLDAAGPRSLRYLSAHPQREPAPQNHWDDPSNYCS